MPPHMQLGELDQTVGHESGAVKTLTQSLSAGARTLQDCCGEMPVQGIVYIIIFGGPTLLVIIGFFICMGSSVSVGK
mgnify:CR=1 FL=1